MEGTYRHPKEPLCIYDVPEGSVVMMGVTEDLKPVTGESLRIKTLEAQVGEGDSLRV